MNVSLGNDYSQPALNDPCPMLVTSSYTPMRMFIVEQQLEQYNKKNAYNNELDENLTHTAPFETALSKDRRVGVIVPNQIQKHAGSRTVLKSGLELTFEHTRVPVLVA
jgi:hypothetical protein